MDLPFESRWFLSGRIHRKSHLQICLIVCLFLAICSVLALCTRVHSRLPFVAQYTHSTDSDVLQDKAYLHDGDADYYNSYRELYSHSSPEGGFYDVWWNGIDAYNTNIIPHPTRDGMYLILAQTPYSHKTYRRTELVCDAYIRDGSLVCESEPTVLPVASPLPNTCPKGYDFFDGGPRDARLFYGPDHPYIMYGSLSQYSCLGLWMTDARMLLEPFAPERASVTLFNQTTELQRVPPYKTLEKNFFIMWSQGNMYVHFDFWPKRSFAQLYPDGSVGEDLAPATALQDAQCSERYLEDVDTRWDLESIHQATNSLSVTLCERSDPKCIPDDSNTFIMHIFHFETNYGYHGIYEPFVVLFQSVPPFAIHAISLRPFWIRGRGMLTKDTGALAYLNHEDEMPEGHTELFYITSINWGTKGQNYHGFLDDTVLIGMGIEDTRSAVMDVLAIDLLRDLAFC